MKATFLGFIVATAALLSPSVQGPSRSSANYSVPAGHVYQERAAVVNGDYLGQSGTLSLMVLNVNIDDFGAYAGAGIDDAWQVHYFGLTTPNAAPTADPDGDGQNNLFEYIAGTDPTDPLAKFQFSIAPVAGQPGQQNLNFSPRFPSPPYTVQSPHDLSAGSFPPPPVPPPTH